MSESTEGQFRVEFGDGVLGQKLTVDNVLIVDYIASSGKTPNTAKTFSATSVISASGETVSVSTTSPASGGNIQESVDEVRFNAALALARNGKRSKSATNSLAKSLTDPNRYVYGYALEALDRIESKKSNAYLKKPLKITRYCPYTSTNSLF